MASQRNGSEPGSDMQPETSNPCREIHTMFGWPTHRYWGSEGGPVSAGQVVAVSRRRRKVNISARVTRS